MEVLIAMMLTGLVTTLALAPVVVTVRRVVELQGSDATALSRTLSFIGRDIAGAVRLVGVTLIIEDHQSLGGGEDDTLIIMSTAPARQQMAAGSVVYKLEEGGPLHGNIPAGLYRWVLPGKLPEQVDVKDLKTEDAQLVLPDVTSFSVEVPKGSERDKTYRGALPMGVYIALTRGREPDAESLEDIVVLP